MIVRAVGAALHLIAQPDHAALAAALVRAWRRDGLPGAARRTDILLAVEQHDNGWQEVDRAPIVDAGTGRILDFLSAPVPIRQSVWPRGIARLRRVPYAAALVAQHALHIYRRHRADPAWVDFFHEIERARSQNLEAAGAGASLDELQRDYLFLRVADLASLTFCNGWADRQPDDSGSDYVVHLDGDRLTIRPDPFDGRDVPISVTARALPSSPFRGSEDARRAFEAAPVVRIDGVACGLALSD
jgi:hypothetical protein